MKTKQKIWANFSVKNAAATNEFYKRVGFTSNGYNKDLKLASFLFGEDDFVIHFFEEGSQIDEFLKPGSLTTSEIIFTLSADTEQQVNEFANKVKVAGGTILKEVRRDEAGYYGFAFADPDGHKFNVLLMDNM
ncbi:VOC family protein [Deminuibacter soli]|uniref:Glyoxalase n=1 Tax=Deminuibacter soli TaxID=2291815 RepID=A0A3E1NKS7_9BACT|nr:VOC family protein [Deminuibacter soli]RFM28540.1 glyoxalase [Deminuibacter soli]